MTSPSSQSNVLLSLMKDVSEAIRLDRSEKNEDAYRKYLECVLRVSTVLLKDLHSQGGHVKLTNDKLKMVKLGQQCMDRITLIVNGRFDQPVVPAQKQIGQSGKGPPTTLPISATPPKSREVTPSPSQQTLNITSPVTPTQPTAKTPVSSVKVSSKLKKLTPMEIAMQQNQQLLSAFKARRDQASRGKHNRAVSANLTLTLQRKMAENLAIAKAQEEILAKKMRERQQRLEEQAAKRFLTPMGLSEEEQHQRMIYRKVLEFEQEELWMIDERKKLEESPTDINVISHLITVILNCETHPLTEQIKIYQNKLLDKVYSLVDGKADRVSNIKVPLNSNMLEKLKPFKQAYHMSANMNDTSTNAEDEVCGENDEVKKEMYGSKMEEKSLNTSKDIKKDDKVLITEDLNSNMDNTSTEKCIDPNGGTGVDGSELHEDDIETVTITVKDEIKAAINEGETVQKKLKQENRTVKTICRQVTEDYDKYNQENMDELFDDDDSDNEYGDETGQDENINDKADKETKELEEELKTCLSTVKKITDSEISVAKLQNEAYIRHLNGITEDILTSIEKVQVLFVITFQELDSAEGRDQCNVLLEGLFFGPLWNSLLLLFRLANEPKELAIASYMTDKKLAPPQDFGVRDKLCLLPVVGNEEFPYQTSIKELLGITQSSNMLEKLDCLVRTSKMVLQNVEQYYRQKEAPIPDIGADDLLPVLCYVVARSGLPEIVSECHAMDRFIHEGYMFGEEGYCLTSFQTAINYLVSQGMENIN